MSRSYTIANQQAASATGFWIIWNPTSRFVPTKKFYSGDQARAVARQMAKDNPGESFFVMHAEGGAHVPLHAGDPYVAF